MVLYSNNRFLDQVSKLNENKNGLKTLDEIEQELKYELNNPYNNRSEQTFLGVPYSSMDPISFININENRKQPLQRFTNHFKNMYNNINNNTYKNEADNKGFDYSKFIPPVGAGLAAALQSPGTYYVQANWKGNGLANTGLGYTVNQNYANPYDVGQMLASLRKINNWSLTKNNLFNRNKNDNDVLEKLSAINEYIDNYEPLNTLEGLTGDFYNTDSMYSDIV